MNKEEIIKRVRRLGNIYDFYFEVYRRSNDPNEKENARIKYHEAIEENIRLQKEHNLQIPPQYSSSERSEMQLDVENERLVFTDKQLREQRVFEDFDKDKKALEISISNNLKERKSEYIKEILDNMSSLGHTSEVNEITGTLDKLGFYKHDNDLSDETKIQLLLPFFVIHFEKFLSGEIFIENLPKVYSNALDNYKEHQMAYAEDLFDSCINMLGRASEHSVLRNSRDYYDLRIERMKSDWQVATNSIKDQFDHERRQIEIKAEVLKLVADKTGILQTQIYLLLDNYKKEEVREAIYFLEKGKNISRQKQGNTYKVFNKA